jgi:predicted RNA binding protein YcfA (HicA-like mRNA interferase family)
MNQMKARAKNRAESESLAKTLEEKSEPKQAASLTNTRKKSKRMSTKNMTVRQFRKLLESRGYKLKRTAGSHATFEHPVSNQTITLAGRASKVVPQGTAKAMLDKIDQNQ